MDTERNLLFGILTFRAGLIDGDQFGRACSRWYAQQNTPLADQLIERGWLHADDKAHVDYLLERHLQKERGNGRAALAALADRSVRGALAGVEDAGLRRWLSDVLPGGLYVEPEDRGRRGLGVAAVVVIAVLLVLGIGGAVVLMGGLMVTRERDMAMMAMEAEVVAQSHQARAEEQRARAEVDQLGARYKAEQELKRTVTPPAPAQPTTDPVRSQIEKELDLGPQAEKLSRDLLEQALQTYEEFLREKPHDAKVRHEVARGRHRLAERYSRGGDLKRAEECQRKALAELELLVQEYPTVPAYRKDLGEAYALLGQLLKAAGKDQEAEPLLEKAKALAEPRELLPLPGFAEHARELLPLPVREEPPRELLPAPVREPDRKP